MRNVISSIVLATLLSGIGAWVWQMRPTWVAAIPGTPSPCARFAARCEQVQKAGPLQEWHACIVLQTQFLRAPSAEGGQRRMCARALEALAQVDDNGLQGTDLQIGDPNDAPAPPRNQRVYDDE